MRIQRLELHGFKSFVEPTVFHLGPGIAAVVGPNGCGKSNVIDAIRWTLGEQSPGTLRGRAMADVIFSGAEGRAPSNNAEVTLVFDNADGGFGGRYSRFAEIAVSRRLTRAGVSTYAINRQRCRLKDVVDLFVDTGVGARAYSIIEQGRVGLVVSAKPEERKLLIDEVAGVNRFKGQRTEAERRMKETRTNLLRVADLCLEMDRQRQSLGAQARLAERFMELRARWKERAVRALAVEAIQLVAKQRGLRRQEGSVEIELAEKRAAEDEAATAEEVARREAELAASTFAAHRESVARLEATASAATQQAKERAEELVVLGERIDRLRSEQTELARVDRGAESRRGQAATSAAEARERLGSARGAQDLSVEEADAADKRARGERAALEDAKQRQIEAMTTAARQRNSIALLRRRIQDTQEELVGEERARDEDAERRARAEKAFSICASSLAAAVVQREQASATRDEAQKAVVTSKEVARSEAENARRLGAELAQAQALLAAEEELVATLADAQPGLRSLVEWLRGPGATSTAGAGFLGVVADLLQVPDGLESSVELALADLVNGAVFGSAEALKDAARWAEEHRPGRAALILLDATGRTGGLGATVGVSPNAPSLPAQLLGGIERLSSLDHLELRVGAVAVFPPSTTVDGVIVRLGTNRGDTSPLTRRARVRKLATEADGAKGRASHGDAICEAAERELAARQSRASLSMAALHEAELVELGCRRDLDAAERAKQRVSDEETRAMSRRSRLEKTAARLAGELERVTADAMETEQQKDVVDGEIESRRVALDAAQREATAAGVRATRAQVELAEARHEAASLERDFRRMTEEVEQRRQRTVRLERELADAERREERLADRRKESAAALLLVNEERTSLLARGPSVAAAAESAKSTADSSRARHLKQREESERVLTRTAQLKNEIGRMDVRAELLRARSREEFAVDVFVSAGAVLDHEEAAIEVPTAPGRPVVRVQLDTTACAEDARALASSASRLARQADALGAVNMAAAEEYAEIDGRWRELTSQKEDLEAALVDLKRAIRTIEQETRQRFRIAFDEVSQRFAALYPRLVGGGKAELLLTDPEDLLTTGVEIRVEPPGKRLQTLQLLSGGEKAMAAIAFVFAIFEVKPSPFCLLDEVDAPLDESNSRRFNGMLAELSATTQFLVITHNRTTMEVADVLYGVTMQSAGVSSVVAVRVDERQGAGKLRGPEPKDSS